MDCLKDENQTTFILVSRPETSSLKEAARTSRELKALGLTNQKLFLNGVFRATDKNDPVAIRIEQSAQKRIDSTSSDLQNLKNQNFHYYRTMF